MWESLWNDLSERARPAGINRLGQHPTPTRQRQTPKPEKNSHSAAGDTPSGGEQAQRATLEGHPTLGKSARHEQQVPARYDARAPARRDQRRAGVLLDQRRAVEVVTGRELLAVDDARAG